MACFFGGGATVFWARKTGYNDDDVKQVCLFLGISIVENPRKCQFFYPIKNIPDRTADGLILSSAAIRIEIWFPQV